MAREEAIMTAMVRCAQCAKTWPRDHDLPCALDDDGTPQRWCGVTCQEAWLAADPKRRDGWVAVSEMSPEALNAALNDIGLALDGVGPLLKS